MSFPLGEVSQGTQQNQGEGLTKIRGKEGPWDKCKDSIHKWKVFVLGDRISESRVERWRRKYRFRRFRREQRTLTVEEQMYGNRKRP